MSISIGDIAVPKGFVTSTREVRRALEVKDRKVKYRTRRKTDHRGSWGAWTAIVDSRSTQSTGLLGTLNAVSACISRILVGVTLSGNHDRFKAREAAPVSKFKRCWSDMFAQSIRPGCAIPFHTDGRSRVSRTMKRAHQ
ncbi:hypothetical protein JQ634_14795 [Bradyrhizobium sp. AUGA SZCCT0240]|uniref:hypothetical protein n=1 Tax=Bradyrhizobium sp. AUGA SZCCT0240 TaxID=2807669 RepID=UPI001BAE2197|nr:hypothetical protein [Bradyrhizobium sp. AUGA SZCCT0240]MBR1254966.1 hypothetical protein [Bradyrhizobium sp. AUGA SZCCT0240]